MSIERRWTAFNVTNDDGDEVDTFFYPGGATLWEAKNDEGDNYPGMTIEGSSDTLVPLTSDELATIASENGLRRVVDAAGNIFYIDDETEEGEGDYDALRVALNNIHGVDLDSYGTEE